MLQESVIAFLSENKLFAGIPRDALMALFKNMVIVNVAAGDYVMREGDIGAEMYLLYQGRLRVFNANVTDKPMAEIAVGEVVGEMALLTAASQRVADVIAVRDSVLIKIDQAMFRSWVSEYPDSAIKMIGESITRLLPNQHSMDCHPVATITLVPADATFDITAFSDHFVKALKPYKRCMVLNAQNDHVKSALENNTPVSIAYLNECEASYDLLIYVAEAKTSEWTKQCLRQADKLLIVSGEAISQLTEAVDYLSHQKNILAEKFLMVIHPPERVIPQGTLALMTQTGAARVLHLRDEVDYKRVARFFTGTSISLVFSGGGLRGAAHIGLYYAMIAKGIPIDCVGGASFGALAAAVVGLRLSKEAMNETSEWVNKTLPALMDYTIPVISLLRGEQLDMLLRHVFPDDLMMEDLWLPTFATATNMTRAAVHVFETGPVRHAIRAAISLPGIFPPVVHDGDIFVDGATFNNLPTDIMHERNNGGRVIASSVSIDLPHERYYAGKDSVSGLDAFLDRFRANPRVHLPPLLEVLINTQFIGAQRHMGQVKNMCDFYLNLNVSEYRILDVKHWNEIIAKGYQRGIRLIDDVGITKESLGIKD